MSSDDVKHGMTRRSAMQLAGTGLAVVAVSADAKEADTACYARAISGGVLSIYALSSRAFRVRFAPDRALPKSPILVDARTVKPAGGRGSGAKTLTLKHIRCIVADDGTLTFTDAKGAVLLKEKPGRVLTASTVQGTPTFAVRQAFASPEDERLYGTGQFQDGHLNVRGLARRLTQVNTQISLPFLLSSKGYGLLWHNTGMVELNPPTEHLVPVHVGDAEGGETINVTTTAGNAALKRRDAVFEGEITLAEAGRYCFQLDVGQAMAHKHHVEIDGAVAVDITSLWLPPTMSFFAELSAGAHKIRILGSANDKPTLGWSKVKPETVLASPVAEAIDYIVIAGPKADAILAEYRRLTGQAPLMPKWAYGYIHCRERYHSSDEILANAAEFRSRKIPLDVIVQDWQYWGRYGWNAMRFDEKDYPDPAALTAKLHAENVRFMLSVWSKADKKSEVGQAFAARNAFIPDTDWIDFFNPRAADFYWGAMRHRLLPLGIDAWWQDATEPENDDLVGRPTAAGPGEKVRLFYPLQVSRTVCEGQRRDAPGRRVMILTRCAFPGQQRYASAVWSGDIGCDFDTLKRQIPAGLNVMAAGHPYWTVDAGGFFRPGPLQYTDPAYHDVLLRWMQYSVFLPLMRVHGYQTNTEPWHYGAAMEAEVRALIEWRYRLLPYIYSGAADVTRYGTSLMRPLVMDFAHDPAALDEAHSFMCGRALHVAPVLAAKAVTWPVYLPETPGGWYDFWTGERRTGGKRHDVPAEKRIPVHVRAGSIVPLGPVVQSTAEADGRELTLRVYAGAGGVFELYDDAGTDYGYEKGAFARVPLIWDDKKRVLSFGAREGHYPGMPVAQRFQIVLIDANGEAAPVVGTYEGRPRSVRL
jgi:alpha-D-xyloside xylohydrolase